MRKLEKKSSEKKNNKGKPKAVKIIAKREKTSTASFVNEPEVEYQIKFKARSNKTIDESWDFRKSNTKEYTHCKRMPSKNSPSNIVGETSFTMTNKFTYEHGSL